MGSCSFPSTESEHLRTKSNNLRQFWNKWLGHFTEEPRTGNVTEGWSSNSIKQLPDWMSLYALVRLVVQTLHLNLDGDVVSPVMTCKALPYLTLPYPLPTSLLKISSFIMVSNLC